MNRKKIIILFAIILIFIFGILLFVMFSIIPKQNPDGKFDRKNIMRILSSESKIFYSDGKEPFGSFINEKHRYYVHYDSLPKALKDAVIAAEDSRFFHHGGFDTKGIIRAILVNAKNKKFLQGASTITQQTVKNLFGRNEKSIKSKLIELADALRLEHRYKKESILEFYLNQFYVDANGHGAGIAAVYFFNKPISDLTLEECAFIAGILKAPKNAEKIGKERFGYVLKRMLETGKITEEQYNISITKYPKLNYGKFKFEEYHAMLSQIENVLDRPFYKEFFDSLGIYDWKTAGLEILTTIDKDMQQHAQKAIVKNLLSLQEKLAEDSLQGALIAIKNGETVAAWSGQDNAGWFNRVFTAERQFGSTWKPLLFALALQLGWYIDDELENEDNLFFDNGVKYTPRPTSPSSESSVTLETAIAKSENVASVWLLANLLNKLDEDELLNLAKKHNMQKDDIYHDSTTRQNLAKKEFARFVKSIGIKNNRNLKELLQMPFGVNEVSLSEMTTAYQSIISGKIYKCKDGDWGEPCIIKEIMDSYGEVIFKNKTISKEIIPDDLTEQMQTMLKEVFDSGTAKSYSKLSPKTGAMGKTGTTNENRTAAFFGAAGQDSLIFIGSYVGFDNNTKMKNIGGASGALPQWMDFVISSTF